MRRASEELATLRVGPVDRWVRVRGPTLRPTGADGEPPHKGGSCRCGPVCYSAAHGTRHRHPRSTILTIVLESQLSVATSLARGLKHTSLRASQPLGAVSQSAEESGSDPVQ